jgi:phosphopantothenoylcysteine decarboxylase/phosphopantothenate--cysteine ligase
MRDKQVVVAFAAETNGDLGAARQKMQAKGANILYLNDVSAGAIFGSAQTEGVILTSNGAQIPVSKTSKDTLAELLLDQALIQLG